MSDKVFNRVFAIVCVVCLLASGLLWGYTAIQKDQCSIIDYIAGEPE